MVGWLGGFRDNVCKGYSNVGIIENLENSIESIGSIPATYDVSLMFGFYCFLLSIWSWPLLRSWSILNVTNATNRQWTRTNSSPFKGKRNYYI